MAKRRRIPWWVTMVAFAIFAGASIAGLAYLRAHRAKSATSIDAGHR